jgi:hypothetical protein
MACCATPDAATIQFPRVFFVVNHPYALSHVAFVFRPLGGGVLVQIHCLNPVAKHVQLCGSLNRVVAIRMT